MLSRPDRPTNRDHPSLFWVFFTNAGSHQDHNPKFWQLSPGHLTGQCFFPMNAVEEFPFESYSACTLNGSYRQSPLSRLSFHDGNLPTICSPHRHIAELFPCTPCVYLLHQTATKSAVSTASNVLYRHRHRLCNCSRDTLPGE